jgi:dienelactone hydrolase
MTDTLAGFTRFVFDDGRWTRPVYRIGSGPAVIVIHEIPGLHPAVLDFARDVAAEGMTVFCPSLFGEPGKPVSDRYINAMVLKLACVGREFSIWAAGRSSPIVDWLRALARQVHAECGGRGVGAVGMCFTGGFALAMMTEPSVVAPVLAEPSLPVGRKHAARLDCSPQDLAVAKARMEAEDLSLLALRFEDDKLVAVRPLPDAGARAGPSGRTAHPVQSLGAPGNGPRAPFGADDPPGPRRSRRRDPEGPPAGSGLLQGTDGGLKPAALDFCGPRA